MLRALFFFAVIIIAPVASQAKQATLTVVYEAEAGNECSFEQVAIADVAKEEEIGAIVLGKRLVEAREINVTVYFRSALMGPIRTSNDAFWEHGSSFATGVHWRRQIFFGVAVHNVESFVNFSQESGHSSKIQEIINQFAGAAVTSSGHTKNQAGLFYLDKDMRAFEVGQRTFGGFSGEDRGFGSFTRVVNRGTQAEQRDYSDSYLDVIKRDGLLRSYRHAPLLTQIGFVVITGFLTIWLCPIGFDRLFPLDANRAKHGYRQRRLGVILSLTGWGSFALLMYVVWLAISY